MKKLAILPLFAILAACQTGPKKVYIPVAQSCVEGDIPAEPAPVNGTLTGDSGVDIGLIAAAEREARAWGKSLHSMLEACR